jgi:hypothetical protein
MGGNETTGGTSYILEHQGTFYLMIHIVNLEHYTVVIEQDMDSVPEFSPMILLSLLTVGLLVALIVARRSKSIK